MSTPTVNPNTLLMPKATAVWLIENTALTFLQIAAFTGMHEIEIEALADKEYGRGMGGRDPIMNGELTRDEIERCQADPAARLKMAKREDLPLLKVRAKGPKYTPVSKRSDKPDAIAWIIKHHPEISDAQICKLIGTTKPTINAVRDRTHSNMQNLKPRHPADLGLCTYTELDDASRKGLKAAGKDPDEVKAQRLAEQNPVQEEKKADSLFGAGFDFSNFLKTDKKSGSGEN